MTVLANARTSEIANSTRRARDYALEIRSFARTRKTIASASILFALFAPFLSTSNVARAQSNVPKSRPKVATLEETSGTSVREFNALRALNRDYLNNPDDQPTPPPDENDLWIPEMSLGRKAQTQSPGARVITYEKDSVKTETRGVATRSPKSYSATNQGKKTGVKSTNLAAKPRAGATSTVNQARYDARANATAPIRQTQGTAPSAGFADYAVSNATPPLQPGQGFGDYDGVERVALRTEEASVSPVANVPDDSADLGFSESFEFPSFDNLPEIESFPSNNPWVDELLQHNGAENAGSIEPTPEMVAAAPTEGTDAPFPTNIDDLLLPEYGAQATTSAELANPYSATNPYAASESSNVLLTPTPNPTTQEQPTQNLSSEELSSSAIYAPSEPSFVETPEIADALAAPYTSLGEIGAQSAEPTNYATPANGAPDVRELTAPETEVDGVVVNGTDEPYRESYRATPRREYETQTYLEKALGLNDDQTASEKAQTSSGAQSLETAELSEEDKKNLIIEDVRISGLEMSTQQFNKIVKTRIGAKFNQQRLEEDKRALLQTKQFIDVDVSTSYSPEKPGKVVVNFDLTPRRMMRYIKVVGNRLISKHDILEELGLRPGESRMDPYEVENGRIRIIEFYKSKEYGEPHVEILRGDRPEDVGVVYLIDEGRKQRVLRTSFIGNSVVSEARLRNLVSVKPGILYFIGGKFSRERLDADVQTLLEYYRNLGYFDARIDREYEESAFYGGLGKDNAWVSVRYIIDEGPRYRIRNFIFNGNRVVSTKDLEAKLKVKRGQYYRFDEIEADRIALRYKYQDLGYVRADVTPNQVFTDEVGVVDIRYDIKEDHRYRVREVLVDYVAGKNQKTADARTKLPVVLNLLDITPGELLDGKKIRMSENTLRQSGYFNDNPEDGQLPEIAVIPDESKSYVLEKNGESQFVKEAKRPDEKEDNKEGVDETTTRGQSRPEPRRITRGQESVAQRPTAARAPGEYVPYESTRTQAGADRNASFQSYGPSATNYSTASRSQGSPNALNASSAPRTDVASRAESSSKTNLLPFVRPLSLGYASVVRGQTRSIPSGFSTVTTQGDASQLGEYRPYDSTTATPSQYSSGLDYANYDSANLLNSNATPNQSYGYSNDYLSSSDVETAPGFSDGVYSSLGRDAMTPVTPETDEIYDGDVLVKVQEGRTGMFQASIGVNSDYGLVGNVSFTERNFDILRFPTALFRCDGWKDAFRGGGQIFNVQASPGTSIQSYRMSWDVPYVFNTKWLFGVTGLYGEHSFDEWFEARYGGEIRFGRQWTNRFSTTLNAGIYNVKIKDPAVGFVPDLNEVLGTSRMYNVGLTAAYDTRNHPYSPSAGYLLKGTVEAAFGDYRFPRASLDARYYHTLRKRVDGTGRWVLGLSSRAGWTGDKTPIFERYYGGGATNLRGFEYREVTPRYLQTGFGIGGKFEFYNTAELYIPVSGGDAFQFVVFCDTGTVAESIKKWGRYRVAPGVGLRFSIPMLGPAPLALDFAFPVNKDKNDVTEVFTFNLSGSR